MITEDALRELQLAQRRLEEMIQPVFEDDDLVQVFFGLCEDEWGWHYVHTDYPSYIIIFMGSTYESALQRANELLEEHQKDMEEDEDEE